MIGLFKLKSLDLLELMTFVVDWHYIDKITTRHAVNVCVNIQKAFSFHLCSVQPLFEATLSFYTLSYLVTWQSIYTLLANVFSVVH